MTLDKFRIMHSELIEHYQFIEMHLEGIYACLSGKPFVEGLEDVATSNITQLVHEIKRLEKEKIISAIPAGYYDRIEVMRLRRNFWCHDCYTKMVFDSKTEAPKKEKDRKSLIDDLYEAENLREELFQIKLGLMHRK